MRWCRARFGGTHRESSPAMPPLQLPACSVALGLWSNACTAFRAFRRSLMKCVTCGLGYGNFRNPTHRANPERLSLHGSCTLFFLRLPTLPITCTIPPPKRTVSATTCTGTARLSHECSGTSYLSAICNLGTLQWNLILDTQWCRFATRPTPLNVTLILSMLVAPLLSSTPIITHTCHRRRESHTGSPQDVAVASFPDRLISSPFHSTSPKVGFPGAGRR